MKRVTNGFGDLSLPQFSQKLEVIVTCMTGNPYFTSLTAEVQELSAQADAYYVLAAKAATRDKNVILTRDASRQKIIGMLHNLGMQVTAIAKSDEEILSSSGFSYTQPKKTTPPMEKPAAPKVTPGVNNGEINCKTTTQTGMKSVNYYITSDAAALTTEDPSSWNIISYNKIRYTFTGLVSGQRYYIKIGLVGVRGQEVISDPVSYIAQ